MIITCGLVIFKLQMIVLSVLQEGEKQREPSKTDQRRKEFGNLLKIE